VSNGITSELADGVACLTLDRPAVMNRFEGVMREELRDALARASGDPAVRSVMITGAGAAFSAGADIEEMVGLHRRGDVAEIRRRVDLGADVIRAVRSMPKPVVAAVNGVAAGAGINLALACDVRVGSDAAAFSESFVRIGLVPDWGGFHSLVRLVGTGRAADLMMTGERIDAERAAALGLLDRVYPAETFARDALAYARRLAEGPPGALARIKAGIALAAAGGLEDVLAFERETQPELFAGADCLEGMTAFLGRRPPEFGQDLPGRRERSGR